MPIVRRKIEEKMAEINSDFRKDVTKRLAGVTVRRELPELGLDSAQVMEEVRDHVALGKRYLIFIIWIFLCCCLTIFCTESKT